MKLQSKQLRLVYYLKSKIPNEDLVYFDSNIIWDLHIAPKIAKYTITTHLILHFRAEQQEILHCYIEVENKPCITSPNALNLNIDGYEQVKSEYAGLHDFREFVGVLPNDLVLYTHFGNQFLWEVVNQFKQPLKTDVKENPLELKEVIDEESTNACYSLRSNLSDLSRASLGSEDFRKILDEVDNLKIQNKHLQEENQQFRSENESFKSEFQNFRQMLDDSFARINVLEHELIERNKVPSVEVILLSSDCSPEKEIKENPFEADFLTEKDISTLNPKKWINDNIIDAYVQKYIKMNLTEDELTDEASTKIAPTFFYNLLSQLDFKKPLKKNKKAKEFLETYTRLFSSTARLFIPMNSVEKTHWSVLLIIFTNSPCSKARGCEFITLDSFSSENLASEQKVVWDFIHGLLKQFDDQVTYVLKQNPRKIKLYKQTNKYDCGVYCINYLCTGIKNWKSENATLLSQLTKIKNDNLLFSRKEIKDYLFKNNKNEYRLDEDVDQ